MKKLRESAEELGIKLVDFNDIADSCGIDIKCDYYDSVHLNVTGAVKLSEYIAEYIDKDLARHECDEKLWSERQTYLEKKRSEESK